MKQRGKKSLASVTVLTPLQSRPLPPPEGFSHDQALLWIAVVATKPAGWFTADTVPILAAYVKATMGHRVVSGELDTFLPEWLRTDEGLARFNRLTAIQDRQARLLSSLATKMRLTQQSRYAARGADRADAKAGGARPWIGPDAPA